MELTTGTTANSTKKLGMNVLKGIGLVLVLAGVIWVGTQGVKNAGSIRNAVANALSGIQSLFVAQERIVLSIVDSQIVVEQPFVVSWEHRGKDSEGTYAFSYDCADDVYLSLKTESKADTTVFCTISVALLETDNILTLTAHGDVDGIENVTVRVTYTENGSSNVTREGELVLPIQDARFDTATSTDMTPVTPTTPVTPVVPVVPVPGQSTSQIIRIGTTPNLFGDPDLTVNFLAVGVVDRKTGKFDERDELPRDVSSSKRAAIQFEIKNEGTNVTGDDWRFDVKLPTNPEYTYKSPEQPTMFPGDRIVYTIGFDRVRNSNEDEYRIRVDIDDDVDESRESNNTESGEIEIDN
ncbi:MAG: hypothetical protein AAB458_00970 [Patescibacteria group bacterium]